MSASDELRVIQHFGHFCVLMLNWGCLFDFNVCWIRNTSSTSASWSRLHRCLCTFVLLRLLLLRHLFKVFNALKDTEDVNGVHLSKVIDLKCLCDLLWDALTCVEDAAICFVWMFILLFCCCGFRDVLGRCRTFLFIKLVAHSVYLMFLGV